MTLLAAVVAACAAVFAGLTWYGRRSASWGATEEEVASEMSGDEWLVGETGGPKNRRAARVRMTRASWVEASAEDLWPRVAQMGRGAGWYSYDRIDNGGRPSARHILAGSRHRASVTRPRSATCAVSSRGAKWSGGCRRCASWAASSGASPCTG